MQIQRKRRRYEHAGVVECPRMDELAEHPSYVKDGWACLSFDLSNMPCGSAVFGSTNSSAGNAITSSKANCQVCIINGVVPVLGQLAALADVIYLIIYY